jgi:hypothetical protein
MLERPRFGEMPPEIPWVGKTRTTCANWRWEPLFQIVKEHPGQPAQIAEYTTGTRRDRQRKVTADRQQIRRHLDRLHPDEYWGIYSRSPDSDDGWERRQLWVVFFADDPQAAEKERQRRKDLGVAMQAKITAGRKRREEELYEKARAHQEQRSPYLPQ